MELKETRFFRSTPTFFKRLRNLAIIVVSILGTLWAGIDQGYLTDPIYGIDWLTSENLLSWMWIIGTIAGVSQFTKNDSLEEAQINKAKKKI